jgi:hypothetical protein
MSEDEDEPPIMEGTMVDMGSEAHDMMGFGPLLPTDSERSLMERVRQELKIELKQVRVYIYIYSSPIHWFIMYKHHHLQFSVDCKLSSVHQNKFVIIYFCRVSSQESRMSEKKF